jgi:two-component sensor histidine kinase
MRSFQEPGRPAGRHGVKAVADRHDNSKRCDLFTIAGGVLTLSARSATTVSDLVSSVSARLRALAQAHALTIPLAPGVRSATKRATTLHALIRTILASYDDGGDNGSKAVVTGPDTVVRGDALTSFALLLHEFATNSAKYGALSTPQGRIDISCGMEGDRFVLIWNEIGGPPIKGQPDDEGFGTLLAKGAVQGQLGGEIIRDWKPEGLSIRLTVSQKCLGA